ncbi:hypothetical protein ACFPIF_07320 [Brevundimonas faecalis]|uniref:hypothetical protein n=1 Tax=Brevundimonas faecalis TaxID=947378 RepID=UPI00361E8729
MSDYDARGLLAAVAAELADIRKGVEATAELTSELLRHAPAEQRLAYLTRTQAFDVLSQRVDALAGLAGALAADQPMDTALAALPLAEMAERLCEASMRGRPLTSDAPARPAASGELILFD